jgi:hypothetical protein
MISIAVKKANCASRDWWREIKHINVCPGASGQAGRVGTVLKIHALADGAAGSAESPLLASVGNVE